MNHDLGWVTINDTGIVTERGPDTVRGADVAFHSYTRIPKGQRPEGYPEVAPDLVFEGRSPTDRWRDLSEKAYEYLAAGVTIVCILDPAHRTITVLRDEQPPLTLLPDADLTFPDLLPGFAVRVERFFA
jgi:Uma2 family endonuclease